MYARTFALFKGLKTETLHDDKSTLPKFNFVKSLELDFSIFNSLENKDITLIDKEYEPENFAYSFESTDGNTEYAIITNGEIDILKENDFKALNVKPVNLKQKLFTKAILSNMYDLLVIDAKAGSGKTLMSIVSSMRLIDLGFYDKIVYVRNSIESLDKGADIGYLSGNDESCMAIVIGSNRQIDNLYLNKYNNGLTTLLKQTNEAHPELKMFAIELEKAVRGKFAQFTERIFENRKD